MRNIIDHQVNPMRDALQVRALDAPGPGGAHHEYEVTGWYNMGTVPATLRISFQCGGIAEAGVNGITNEVLLAIVLDRLKCFQAGPFPDDRNSIAAEYVQAALDQLHKRTMDRVARGVEGKSVR